ncbi:MAG TPA: hypothetical protein VHW72_03220 [Candidatus Angelobacter sp.]|jgi:hypothetical protein|nr:hypothetical protein [Candidatus Angelobacter sp.]
MRLKTMMSAVIPTPRRKGVRGSPAARKAPVSMKNIIRPKMLLNIARINGSASAFTSGAAFTTASRVGEAQYPPIAITLDKASTVRKA